MKKVACNFRTGIDQNLSQVKFVIMAANNHYGGFSPGHSQCLCLLGLEEVKWGDGYLVTDDLAGEDDVLTGA
jgi:hypothetical protein